MSYEPSQLILQQRANLAKSLSALRRVTPRVPFWKLAAHRVPTLWSLYRGLLREAPGDDVKWRIRMFFERYRSLTSPETTRQKLVQMHKYLDAFRAANNGSEKWKLVLTRYNDMIAVKREKAQMRQLILKELAWQERLRNRPILTGAYLRPSMFNGPLPRMKPQPVGVSMMIRKRRLAHEHRQEKFERLIEIKRDIIKEAEFEHALAKTGPVEALFRNEDWAKGIAAERARLRSAYARDNDRLRTQYPAALLAQIKDARREKILNKTRERERERRGEHLKHAASRKRQGPPAALMVRMSERQRSMDRVVRGVSEVGYVALVKKKAGRRLRDESTWKSLEDGKEEHRQELDKMSEAFWRVAEERRRDART